MDIKRVGHAERLIRGEAIRFMSQQSASSEMLSQPSLWLDEDVAVALRRAMDMERVGQAEKLIRGEAIRFMRQQQSASSEASLQFVLAEQPKDVPPSAPTTNLLDELCQKYGF